MSQTDLATPPLWLANAEIQEYLRIRGKNSFEKRIR
jgi:hypothetical protein